jgi:hypothetical protein
MRAIKSLFRSAWAEFVLFALTIGVGITASGFLARTVVIHVPPAKNYNTYSCRTENTAAPATFKVLDLFRLNTRELADRLCVNPMIAARYGAVEVTWMLREQLDLRAIVDQTYELVLAKPELLKRVTETRTGYVPLASYQEYVSQLIAIDTKPELSSAYFVGKRLGMVDDPNSVSGYQVPKAALQQAQIDESSIVIRFYKSHAELHRALFTKQVDVIASYSAAYFGDERLTHQLDLRRGLTGLQWYLHPGLRDTAIHCELYHDLTRYPSAVGAISSIVKPMECADAR